MKKLFFLMLTCGFVFTAIQLNAQIRKIPAEVTDSFKAKYPAASGVEWKDKLTVFQANFTMDNAKYQAKFNSRGEWQGSEKRIKLEELPASVKDGLSKSKYADWKTGAIITRYLPGDKTVYSIGVSKSDLQKKNLLFNSDGQLLKDNSTL